MRARVILVPLLVGASLLCAQAQAQNAKPAYCAKKGEFQDRIHAFQRCIAEAARAGEATEHDIDKAADNAVASCGDLKDPLIDFVSLCGGDNGVEVIGRQADVFHLWGVEAVVAFRANRQRSLEKST